MGDGLLTAHSVRVKRSSPVIKLLANSRLQLVLLLLVAPLLSGTIKTLKARLQTRRGPGRSIEVIGDREFIDLDIVADQKTNASVVRRK